LIYKKAHYFHLILQGYPEDVLLSQNLNYYEEKYAYSLFESCVEYSGYQGPGRKNMDAGRMHCVCVGAEYYCQKNQFV
jgi:hypothetical protein